MFMYAGGSALKGATAGINFGSKAFIKQTALDGILGMAVGGIDGYSNGESGYDLAKTSLKSGAMFGGMSYFMSAIKPLRNPLKSVFSKESSEVVERLEGKMSRSMFEIPEGGVAGDNRGNFLKTSYVKINNFLKNRFLYEALSFDGEILNHLIEYGNIKRINGQRRVNFVINKEENLILGKKH